MGGYDTNEMIKEIFNTLLRRYQEGLEESIKVVILCVHGLHYKFHKISLNRVK